MTWEEVKREHYRPWMKSRVETLRRERGLSKKTSWRIANAEWLGIAKRISRQRRRITLGRVRHQKFHCVTIVPRTRKAAIEIHPPSLIRDTLLPRAYKGQW